MAFSETEYEILTLVEQDYLLTRCQPTMESISERLGHSLPLVKRIVTSDKFKAGMNARGIDTRSSAAAANGVLTAIQLTCANTMLDFTDGRSDKKKLQDLKINSQTYQGWLRDPGFASYLLQRSEQLLGDVQSAAHLALVDNVRRGDLGSIKYLNEMTGRWSSKTVGEVNIEFLMMKILETIQRHVTDADQLMAIADELVALSPTSPSPGFSNKPLPLAVGVFSGSSNGQVFDI